MSDEEFHHVGSKFVGPKAAEFKAKGITALGPEHQAEMQMTIQAGRADFHRTNSQLENKGSAFDVDEEDKRRRNGVVSAQSDAEWDQQVSAVKEHIKSSGITDPETGKKHSNASAQDLAERHLMGTANVPGLQRKSHLPVGADYSSTTPGASNQTSMGAALQKAGIKPETPKATTQISQDVRERNNAAKPVGGDKGSAIAGLTVTDSSGELARAKDAAKAGTRGKSSKQAEAEAAKPKAQPKIRGVSKPVFDMSGTAQAARAGLAGVNAPYGGGFPTGAGEAHSVNKHSDEAPALQVVTGGTHTNNWGRPESQGMQYGPNKGERFGAKPKLGRDITYGVQSPTSPAAKMRQGYQSHIAGGGTTESYWADRDAKKAAKAAPKKKPAPVAAVEEPSVAPAPATSQPAETTAKPDHGPAMRSISESPRGMGSQVPAKTPPTVTGPSIGGNPDKPARTTPGPSTTIGGGTPAPKAAPKTEQKAQPADLPSEKAPNETPTRTRDVEPPKPSRAQPRVGSNSPESGNNSGNTYNVYHNHVTYNTGGGNVNVGGQQINNSSIGGNNAWGGNGATRGHSGAAHEGTPGGPASGGAPTAQRGKFGIGGAAAHTILNSEVNGKSLRDEAHKATGHDVLRIKDTEGNAVENAHTSQKAYNTARGHHGTAQANATHGEAVGAYKTINADNASRDKIKQGKLGGTTIGDDGNKHQSTTGTTSDWGANAHVNQGQFGGVNPSSSGNGAASKSADTEKTPNFRPF